jgi:hypothetical protein
MRGLMNAIALAGNICTIIYTVVILTVFIVGIVGACKVILNNATNVVIITLTNSVGWEYMVAFFVLKLLGKVSGSITGGYKIEGK